MRFFNLIHMCAVLLSIAFYAARVDAGIVNHGDFVAENYSFLAVTEDSISDALPHYGGFGTVGDTLLVEPIGFGVQVVEGPGVSLLESSLQMMIVPNVDTASVGSLSYSEQGNYTVVGDGEAMAAIPFFWQIIEVDDIAVSPVISGNGTANVSGDSGTGVIWELGFSVDLAAELATAEAGRGVDYGSRITKVNLRFDNSLVATAGDDQSVASIKKQQTDGIRITIPEPASLASALWIFAVLIWRRRRCLNVK